MAKTANELQLTTKEEMLAHFLELTCRAGELMASLGETSSAAGDAIAHLSAAQGIAIAQQYLREQKAANWFSGLLKWIPK